nr:MAG TPA: hypothetical protein [Caudoviricetes sp.]
MVNLINRILLLYLLVHILWLHRYIFHQAFL